MITDPVSPMPAIASILFAILTTYFLVKKFGSPSESGRFVSIDGLRGYLAFFVYLHHSCIWFFYLKTGIWKSPPSNLYASFGPGSVAFFFMITGFLFSTKIIEGKKNGIDWLKLFVSRILRLVPLYFFAMLLLFLIIADITNFTIYDTPINLIKNLIKWLSFTILDSPNINGVENTSLIMAGVTWSLPYEWLFYLSLPILALVLGNFPPVFILILGGIGILGFSTKYSGAWHLLSFASGIAVAFLVRFESFRTFSSKKISSYIVLSSIFVVSIFLSSTYALLPFILLSLSFSLIAGGNTLFGALSNSVSRTLGEMAYSIYLLHGIALFLLLNFLISREDAKLLTPTEYWLSIIVMSPVLVLICFITFNFIERPAMQSTHIVTKWIRFRFFGNSVAIGNKKT